MGPLRNPAKLVTALIALVAMGAGPVRAEGGGLWVESRAVGDLYVVQGAFEVKAGVERVWGVLSDYDHLGRYVRSLTKSEVKERRADGVLLEQEAVGHALFLSRAMRVLLEVREVKGERIEFRDVGRGDFELYQGAWTLTADGQGTKVAYLLRAKPRSGVPAFVASGALRSTAVALLDQVKREIERRGDPRLAKETSR